MIIDAFLFYNELDILETRLKLLENVVDKFVLVESLETFVGNTKPLFFSENKDRYARWIDKIIHVIVPKMPWGDINEENDEDKFCIEKHQRHQIVKGLAEIPDDAIVLISDVDEIPHPDVVKHVKPDASLHMIMFEYSVDYMFTGEYWIGTVVTTAKRVKELGPNHFRFKRWNFPIMENSGWHFSSFGNSEHVFNKIQNYAHSGDSKHEGQTVEDFEEYIKNGIHSDGKTKLVKTPKELASHVKYLLSL